MKDKGQATISIYEIPPNPPFPKTWKCVVKNAKGKIIKEKGNFTLIDACKNWGHSVVYGQGMTNPKIVEYTGDL